MPGQTEAQFKSILLGESGDLVVMRKAMRRIPTSPRCKLCAAPFGGAGGAVLRHVGFGRFPGNPAICNSCVKGFRKSGVTGAEIPVTLLFADIRGSTGLGERLRPAEFRAYLDRFYRIGSDVILGHDGLVDKLVGDEIIGLFFGGVTGKAHAAAAIDAAVDLLREVGRADATPTGPIPVGAGVHFGEAFVGATGPEGAVDDFTALGDVVNTTARLASAAAAGELLVSVQAAHEASRDPSSLGESRTIAIRGREQTLEVLASQPLADVARGAR